MVQQDQLLDIYGDSCDRLKKDYIFNATDRFVDVIYLMYIIGTNSRRNNERYSER